MFTDSYTLKWKLSNGFEEWTEEHTDISLSDFEVIYGNNIHEIKWVRLVQVTNTVMEEEC
ncbi:MAG TPA: hypothetical protein VLG50_03275 [Candidatus Saccharimonadales bacterium]|nr:hypothetical protein [Candidatus Saccharimonadales bacterium]